MKQITYCLFLVYFLLNVNSSYSQSTTCGAATALPINTTCTNTAFTNNQNGVLGSGASCSTGTFNQDVWYTVTGNGASIDITLSGSNRNSALSVYTGCISGEVGCTMINAGSSGTVTFSSTFGTTYYVRIQRMSGNNNWNQNGNICAVSTNNALNFDGVDDIASATNASSLITNSNMSMTCWANLENPAAGWPNFDGILGFRNNSNADFYMLQLSSTSYEVRFRNSSGVAFDIVAPGVSLNTWQHLAVTYDGTTLTFYINGSAVGNIAANGFITSSTQQFDMGFTTYASEFDLDGSLDEVSLWSRGLTASEVLCIYNDGVTTSSVSQSNLELYYDMNQGIGNGNNTTITQAIDGTGSINAGLSNFTLNGTSSNFIPSPITFTPCLILPIELIKFEAIAVDNRFVDLSWSTSSENNNDYFVVEKSVNMEDWEFVATLDGAGQSTEELLYSTKDLSPYQEISYYRLTQVDFDGSSTQSKIKSVFINHSENAELLIFPNPTTGLVTINGDEEALKNLQLFNFLGQQLKPSIVANGVGSLTLDLSALDSGIYLCRGMEKTHKIIKK